MGIYLSLLQTKIFISYFASKGKSIKKFDILEMSHLLHPNMDWVFTGINFVKDLIHFSQCWILQEGFGKGRLSPALESGSVRFAIDRSRSDTAAGPYCVGRIVGRAWSASAVRARSNDQAPPKIGHIWSLFPLTLTLIIVGQLLESTHIFRSQAVLLKVLPFIKFWAVLKSETLKKVGSVNCYCLFQVNHAFWTDSICGMWMLADES